MILFIVGCALFVVAITIPPTVSGAVWAIVMFASFGCLLRGLYVIGTKP